MIPSSYYTVCVDARRQARRAFLAFSSDDSKVEVTKSGPVKRDSENLPEQLVNDDFQSCKSTPVRNFPQCLLYKCYRLRYMIIFLLDVERFYAFSSVILGDCGVILICQEKHQNICLVL